MFIIANNPNLKYKTVHLSTDNLENKEVKIIVFIKELTISQSIRNLSFLIKLTVTIIKQLINCLNTAKNLIDKYK